jgi:3-oxoadipate enol-lactonase
MSFIVVNDAVIHYKYMRSSPLAARGRTFLFVNSLGTDFRIWDELVAALKDYGDVLLYDKRGHGLSDIVGYTKGLEDYMEDVVALCKHLSIETFTIIGLSVGGMIAQLLAYHYPEKVDRLILCDTRHKIGNSNIWNDRIAAVKDYGIQSISSGVVQRWFSKFFHEQQPSKVAGYSNMLERTSALGYIKTCEAIRDADLTEIAKSIKTYTLCVVGSEDKSTTPNEVKNLADLIEGSEFVIIKGSGHIPCVDNPEVLSNLIIDFVKQ